MIPDQLKLQSGQEELTPEQEAEVWLFAEAFIAAQLATAPVDEPETEALLTQAYGVAGLPPPRRIHWVDGPGAFAAALAPHKGQASVWHTVDQRAWAQLCDSLRKSVGDRVGGRVSRIVETRVRKRVRERVGDGVEASIWADFHCSPFDSTSAYYHAPHLAYSRFFDTYLEPNALHALAHFNEPVSRYWLDQEEAIILRRPSVLTRNRAGRLHSATGMCLQYRDGWGIYAWHGVRVREKAILAPERLSRKDFLNAPNVEVRRVIQERMGERFVTALGGVVLDAGSRVTLYEVQLPDDPERVARYVQVQDAANERRYFLRVPPTIQTAAEAVAWTFRVAEDDYRLAHET